MQRNKVYETLFLFSVLLCGCMGQKTPVSEKETPAVPLSTPYSLISQENLFSYLEDLTSIQAYSGWRNSATEGESAALDYVTGKLGTFSYLRQLGMEIERQNFLVFLSTELWETNLRLKINGKEAEVPVNGLRGPRDEVAQALHFDSDEKLNDRERNPVIVEGGIVTVSSHEKIESLGSGNIKGKIIFLDYDMVSTLVVGNNAATENAKRLLDANPAGIILVTQFSDVRGKSHGFAAGEGGVFSRIDMREKIPILYARIEDMFPAGISDWNDLNRIESARLVWDADVFSPGDSGNLIARIPGTDGSRAVILGAHIDSPNSPGAMDDGSGSASLLEIARVLNETMVKPPVDLYLAWFGSEELVVYGSSYFAATHQELLDKTIAMVEVDCLSRPLDGLQADVSLIAWSYGRFGNGKLTLPDFLAQAYSSHGVRILPHGVYYLYGEPIVFNGFNVPNANLIYTNDNAYEAMGSWHYAAHVHDPYDTVERAMDVGDVLVQMTRVALAAALEIGKEKPELRVTPKPEGRILFIASHTESVHMTPALLVDLGMALSYEGFDVDMIPYGQKVTPADLENVRAIFVLPVHDYPSPEGNVNLYDEAWSQEETNILEDYVAKGGFLILANSAHRLVPLNMITDPNEDWPDLNAVSERFGIHFDGEISSSQAQAEEHELMRGVYLLRLLERNGISFTVRGGKVLAFSDGKPIVALVNHGEEGQVLVIGDLGIVGSLYDEPFNLTFLQNLAHYIRSRKGRTNP